MLNIKEYTKEKVLIFDGAMGTMLQQSDLKLGELPELLCLTNPDAVTSIHKQYVEAGADVITANTFQASEFKLNNVEEVISSAVSCAKKSGAKYVALDIGPLGQLMEPIGTLKFDKAYDAFKKQMTAGEKAGADVIIIETMSDLYEVKSAVLAAKENTNLPVICSMTFQEDNRTFVGCDAKTATITLNGLGVDAIGVNCSLGPELLKDCVDEILKYSKVPVIIQSNAGMPITDGETTYFDLNPEQYAVPVMEMVKKGVKIVGGCCGTTPEHIAVLKNLLNDFLPVEIEPISVTACTSGLQTSILDDVTTAVGERLNPTGKKVLQEALRQKNYDYILNEAISQVNAGANILDVNTALPDLDERALLKEVTKQLQTVVHVPLQIDSSDPDAIEAAVRIYNGKPVINSVNGKKESMEKIFPIAKKYGALIVCLTLDEKGIPKTAAERLKVAEKIVKTAEAYGINKEDLIVDCLVLTVSAQQALVKETLAAIKLVKSTLGVKTILGVSNISFGLPQREIMNSAFLLSALGAGLDAAIINPNSEKYQEVLHAFRAINNEDKNLEKYIEYFGDTKNKPVKKTTKTEASLAEIIKLGRKDVAADFVKNLLKKKSALEIIDEEFIPALNEVGKNYEIGKIFLPQLLLSAQTVQNGFDVISQSSASNSSAVESKGKIVLATVYGDIHDIGKNIVKMLLKNYGYDIIDLGKDVPAQKVIDAIIEHNVKLVGLSALMTTTVKSMKDTITAVKNAGLDCKFIVGGAVLTEEYKDFVGADYYAKDAMESVKIANFFFTSK